MAYKPTSLDELKKLPIIESLGWKVALFDGWPMACGNPGCSNGLLHYHPLGMYGCPGCDWTIEVDLKGEVELGLEREAPHVPIDLLCSPPSLQ